MPVASIIGAVVALATTITGAAISSSDTEDAQNEARRLNERGRQDALDLNDRKEKLEKARIGIEKKRLSYGRIEAEKSRKERGLERGIAARDKQQASMMGLVNSNEVLKSNFLNMWQRQRGGK